MRVIKIAIVEDDDEEADALINCIDLYKHNNQIDLKCTRFSDAESFLISSAQFDMVFMDIMLPKQSGMEAAATLRKRDENIVIIFVTTMAQFAIRGYEVNALDYILKPVAYDRLTLKLKHALDIVKSNREEFIVINDVAGVAKISCGDIYYIEVRGHKLTYYTEKGEYNEYGTLSNLEKMLKPHNFMRCNSCYLVNPCYIAKINHVEQSVVLTNGVELKISQPKRKAFLTELTNWLGQGKC